MEKYINELLSKKCVYVPIALACAFVVECIQQNIVCDGGEFAYEQREIAGQYFYL